MDEKRKRRVRSYFGFVISLILGHATQRQRSSACRRQQKNRKKPSGNASQLAGNDAQPRETSTTGADEVMHLIRALGYVPKETISKIPIVRHLACNIRRMKKEGDRLAVRN